MSLHRSTHLSFIPGLPKVAATPNSLYRSACSFRNAPTASPLHSAGATVKLPQRARSSNAAPNVSSIIAKNVSSKPQPTSLHSDAIPSLTLSPANSPCNSSTPNLSSVDAPSTNPPEKVEVKRQRGHKHTDESRRKISVANRGNIPWNKGRRHSEETKRKIAESTRRAMLRPEMREKLKTRAKGRKHSEETKLKIREKARMGRSAGVNKSLSKKRPVPFQFTPQVVADVNYRIEEHLADMFEKAKDAERLSVVQEKKSMSPETRAKLSQRIKEMWADPAYRARVASGVEKKSKLVGNDKSDKKQGKASKSLAKERAEQNSIPKKRVRSRGLSKEPKSSRDDTPRKAAAASDGFFDADALDGWTKEDLGIIGSDIDGPVQLTGILDQDQDQYGLYDENNEQRMMESSTRHQPPVVGSNPDKDSFIPSQQLSHHNLPTFDNRGSADEPHPHPKYISEGSNHISEPAVGFHSDPQEIDISRLDIAFGNNQPEANDILHASTRDVFETSLDGIDTDFTTAPDDIAAPAWPDNEIAPLPSSSYNMTVNDDGLSHQTPELMPTTTPVTCVDQEYRGFDFFDDEGTVFGNSLKPRNAADFGLHARRRDEFSTDGKRAMSIVDRKDEPGL